MSKKKFKYLCYGFLSILPLSAVALAVGCSNNSHASQVPATLSFNPNFNESETNLNSLNPTNNLPSQINSGEIEQYVFNNSKIIFNESIENYNQFLKQVQVNIISHDDAHGTLVIKITITKSGESKVIDLKDFKTSSSVIIPDKPSTPQPDKPTVKPKPPVIHPENKPVSKPTPEPQPTPNPNPVPVPPSPPSNPSSSHSNQPSQSPHQPEKPSKPENPPITPQVPNKYNAIRNVDYFVIPGCDPNNQSDWVTLPTTKNQKLIAALGNVPLPWKKDSEITAKDISYMFDVIVGGDVYIWSNSINIW